MGKAPKIQRSLFAEYVPQLLVALASGLILAIVVAVDRSDRTQPVEEVTRIQPPAAQAKPKEPVATLLEQIEQSGELIIVTRNSPTTYFIGPDGPVGLEYDLATAFADYLGVEARFVIPEKFNDILEQIEDGEAHIAAAGLTALKSRKKRVRFGPSYQKVSQQLVHRSDRETIPKKIAELKSGTLKVIQGSSHDHQLQKLRSAGHLTMGWTTTNEFDSEQLLYLVHEKELDFTVADSNEVEFNIRYFPKLRVAFALTEPQPIAWALKKGSDKSLAKAVSDFFAQAKSDGMIDELLRQYYGHVDQLKTTDFHAFWKNVNKRLPRYEALFKKVADEFGYEWELLAAIGYQESHWDPSAVSPTGVKGMMMLTNAAAKQVKIADRVDPEQSVIGSARYLKLLDKQIPQDIEEPDRLWLTLAGYNIGFGHLEDARVLTERLGGDTDSWYDVRAHLPLLGQKKWYSTLKYGYARGRAPVKYVDNIRNYYELLLWYNSFRTVEPGDIPSSSGEKQATTEAVLAPSKDKHQMR